MNILLVEDEPELSMVATQSMRNMGHNVIPVSSVKGALEVLNDESADINVLIADHRLPDGWGITLSLECQAKHPRIKIGVVSGVLTPKDVDTLEEYKIPYWRKPVIYSKILKELLRPKPPTV